MPSKRPVKKAAQIEVVAAKSADQLTEEFLKLQNAARLTISDLTEAFITKKAELDALLNLIGDKEIELTELIGKEKLALSIKDLEETFKDNKYKLNKELERIKEEHKEAIDAMARIEEKAEEDLEYKEKSEERSRKTEYEDQDRERDLAYQDRLRDISRKEAEINEIQVKAEAYKQDLEAKLAKQIASVKREYEFKMKQLETSHEAQIKIADADIIRLGREVAELQERLVNSEQALSEIFKQNNEIAKAALETQSGKQALEKMEGIAQEQAKSGRR